MGGGGAPTGTQVHELIGIKLGMIIIIKHTSKLHSLCQQLVLSVSRSPQVMNSVREGPYKHVSTQLPYDGPLSNLAS